MTTHRQRRRQQQREAAERMEREARGKREMLARKQQQLEQRVKRDQPRRDIDADMPYRLKHDLGRVSGDLRVDRMPDIVRLRR